MTIEQKIIQKEKQVETLKWAIRTIATEKEVESLRIDIEDLNKEIAELKALQNESHN